MDPQCLSFDPTQDDTGNGGGSCRVEADFSTGQNLLFIGLYGPFGSNILQDLSIFSSVEFDLKWDSSSTLSLADFNTPPSPGTSGITLASVPPDCWCASPVLGDVTIPAAAISNWVHVSIPINPILPGLGSSQGLWFSKFVSAGSGTAKFWLDNVQFQGLCCPPSPPFLLIQMATRGLNLLATTLDPSDRESIRTAPDSGLYSWLGNGDAPVSYAFTITHLSAATTNFQVHLFLIPNAGEESAPDYIEPAVIDADLRNAGTDNHARWTFRYKTNSANSGIPFPFEPAQITNDSLLGTWTLSFRNDTNVTMTAPDGASINFNLPAEAAACFVDPLSVYFGIQPNEPANISSYAVLARVQIHGAGLTPILDDFSSGLDTNVWQIVAASANSVQVVPDNAYWINWTGPDAGYVLMANTNLANASGWSSNQLPVPFANGWRKSVLLTADLANGVQFFRLQK
ncbi:MAG: hypothetical protein WAO02_04385 [Verrucomicrobiia bacterium]